MAATTNFALPHMDASASMKSTDYNEALPVIDALLSRSVEDSALTAPPGSPDDGLIWAVAASATGDWAGHDGELALFTNGGWIFLDAPAGVVFRDKTGDFDVSSDGSSWSVVSSGGGAASVMVVNGELPNGTVGGTSIAGVQTRALSIVKHDGIPGASLSSNQITLPAGNYFISAFVSAFKGARNRAFLYDTGGAADLLLGPNCYMSSSEATALALPVQGMIVLPAETVFELRHYSEKAVASNGFGVDVSAPGQVEIYSTISITKI